MNELQIFNYEGTTIRTLLQNGEPWWVLADVCRVLELSEPHRVAARATAFKVLRNLWYMRAFVRTFSLVYRNQSVWAHR